ncbi:deoxyribonuclease-1-like 1 [Genypterus blacodes]|uniref:deoxyribonuclease-1-like 1 n=1 Tax=Genypterus blacodes TaxID=154954 RepID=UPI003F770BEA
MTYSTFMLLFLMGVCGAQGASHLRICAFNLHNFGESKTKKPEVMETLVRIISRCDVSLLQEVRDQKQQALKRLLDQLNRYAGANAYSALESERLGRSDSYQEQYVFLYRTRRVTVIDQYQYPDTRPGRVDAFSREPFIVRFRAPTSAIKDFVLIPQHTSPTNATEEIDALYDVLQDIKKKWKTENVMLLGDFNADCSYLPKKNRKNVRLLTDPNLFWFIGDDADTTVRASTSCAYDRIVVNGQQFARATVSASAKAFNFQEEYHMTEDMALDVSDHYPVEILLKAAASTQHEVCFSLLLILLTLIFTHT